MNPVIVKNITIGAGMPKICVPLTGPTEGELSRQTDLLLQAPFDMVEWRADLFEGLPDSLRVIQAVQMLREKLGDVPILFTLRTSREGGQCALPLETYLEYNFLAAKSGAVDLVDLEFLTLGEALPAAIPRFHQAGVNVIVSSHDFQKTPPVAELLDRMGRMQKTGADIIKLAVMPRNRADVLGLLEATLAMSESDSACPMITISMGSMGAISRICGEFSGSAVTFATAGQASAPGQIPAAELLPVLRMLHSHSPLSPKGRTVR